MRLIRPAVLAATVLLAGGIGLAGCSTDYGPVSNLITVNGSEPQNPLVPTNSNENGGGRIVDRLFAGLRWIDGKGDVHDEIAQSIDTTDNKVFDVKLKPGWTFTDGTPVTAKSFVDAWNYGALGTNAQLQSYVFTPIEGFADVQADPPKAQTMSGLKVLGDNEFTITLTAPNIDFKSGLAFSPFYPLPEVAYKDMAAFGEHPIGNGPYKMADGDAWQHNVKLDVVPNPGYHGGRPAKNEGLSFVFYQSFETAYSDLLADNLDFLDTIPDSALTIYHKELGDRAIEAPTAQNQYLGIQMSAPHFAGEEGTLRRRAISLAINRKQIGDSIFHGTRLPSLDFTSRALPGFNGNLPGVENLAYNPDEAKKLWEQANKLAPWSGKFEIAYNSDGGHQAWIDAIANSVKNTLGIEAVGAPFPTFKQLRDQVTTHKIGSKAFRHGWQGDYPTMLQFLVPNFLSTSDTNDDQYNNPEYDKLIHDAEAAPTDQASWQIVGQAQTLLLRDLPSIPIFDYVAAAGRSTNLSHAEMAWNGLANFENLQR